MSDDALNEVRADLARAVVEYQALMSSNPSDREGAVKLRVRVQGLIEKRDRLQKRAKAHPQEVELTPEILARLGRLPQTPNVVVPEDDDL